MQTSFLCFVSKANKNVKTFPTDTPCLCQHAVLQLKRTDQTSTRNCTTVTSRLKRKNSLCLLLETLKCSVLYFTSFLHSRAPLSQLSGLNYSNSNSIKIPSIKYQAEERESVGQKPLLHAYTKAWQVEVGEPPRSL